MRALVAICAFVAFGAAAQAQSQERLARQQPQLLAFFEPFIGDWRPASADAPPDAVAQSFRWGPDRIYVQFFETFPRADPSAAVAHGMILWDHLDARAEFVMTTRYGWVMEGSYRALPDGRLERVYDVHYAQGEPYMPEPERGGQVRRFREVFAFDGPDALEVSLEIERDGAWAPFSVPSYRLARAPAV